MPHPLPEDINAVEGLRWFLVAVPDDPAYTRAAMDVYTELANFWKWGKEGPVPVESDLAAQQWSNAVYETIEAYQMGFPDILLSHIDEVEALLRQLQIEAACCEWIPGGDQVIADDEAGVEDSDTDIEGEIFPDGITDEPSMRDYLCGAATALVDQLIATPARWATYASWGISGVILLILWYTGGAFLAIAGASIAGILTLANILDAVDIFTDLKELVNSGEEPAPSAVESELTGARDDMICAIVDANDAAAAATALRGVIASAVTSTAWENALFVLARDSIVARVFNNLSDAPPATCDCVETFDFDVTFTFDANAEEWELVGPGIAAYQEAHDALAVSRSSGLNGKVVLTPRALYFKIGLSSPQVAAINKIDYTIFAPVTQTNQVGRTGYMDDTDTLIFIADHQSNLMPDNAGAAEEEAVDLVDPKEIEYNTTDDSTELFRLATISGSGGGGIVIDNVRVRGTFIA